MTNRPMNLCSPIIGRLEKRSVQACLESGFVSSVGPLIAEFEQQFARRVGARYAVATASGTAALHVALRTLDIGAGAGVVVPDLTFVASVNPIIYVNAQPLLVDVHPETWTLDPAVLEALCKKMAGRRHAPRAVIPVHLYGCPCDMPALRRIARRYRLVMIEDATEALGTTIGGRPAGAWSEIGCFSFNGNKMITTGGGGMLVTDSRRLADRARHLVNQARISATEYLHDTAGFNYRMTNLTAALGLAQLQRLDGILRRKRRIAARYRQALARRPAGNITPMPEPAGTQNCAWLYSVLFKSAAARKSAARRMARAGIPTRNFFVPLHRQPYLQAHPLWTIRHGRLIRAPRGHSDALADRGLNLPSSPELTAAAQARVCAALVCSEPGN